MIKVAELFAYLGVIADEKKAKDFFHVLEGGKNVLFTLAAMAVGSSVAIGAMLDKSLRGAIALSQFEAQTGLSAQRLQEWQHVGESLGLTADSVTNSISSLNDKLQMIKLTGAGAEPYSMLGINPLEMRDAWDVLDRLRKIVRSRAVPRQTMSALVRQMGLGAEMIKALELTMEQYDKRANLANIITKDQINAALEYNARLKMLGQTITYLFTKAFAEMAPAAIEMIDGVLGWIDENREDIEKAIISITTVLGGIAKEIASAFATIDKIVKKTVGWENAFKGMAAAILILRPSLAILAGIALALKEIDYFMTARGSAFEKFDRFMRGKGGGLISRGIGVPTAFGERIGRQWFGYFDRLEDLINPQKGREAEMLRPENLLKLREPLPGLEGVGLNITQHITSSADANEVARISAEEIGKVINRASLQTAGG